MSSKLRPVEEVAQGLYGRSHDERIERAQADREATVEACAEAFATYIRDIIGGKPSQRAIDAILAVAKPPESTRERLGRALYKAWVAQVCDDMPPAEWHDLTDGSQEQEMEMAAAVQAELALIQEEADG